MKTTMATDTSNPQPLHPQPHRVRIPVGLFDSFPPPPRPLSATRLRVLYLLHLHQPVTARRLAYYLWPDSLASRRVSRGGVRGVGAWLAAGSMVGKMVKMGLVWRDEERDWRGKWYFRGYMLTDEGRRRLLERVTVKG